MLGVRIGLIVGFLLALSVGIAAQQPSTGPPADRTNPDRARMQNMSRREMQLRGFGHLPDGSKDLRSLKAIAAQVEEDFERILIRHNEIARAIAADKSLDYRFVTDATTEIQKRANRLKSRLVFYESSEDKKDLTDQIESFDDAHVKDALISLCKKIRSFVTNPVIETPGTIDVKQSARAGRDLERVIELSGSIHKSAERLAKKK